MTTIYENHDVTFEHLARLRKSLNTLEVGIDMKLLLPMLRTAAVAASKVVTTSASSIIVPSTEAKERMSAVKFSREVVNRPQATIVAATPKPKAVKAICKDTPDGYDCTADRNGLMNGIDSEWNTAPDNDTRLKVIEKILTENPLFLSLYDGSQTGTVRSVLCDSCRTWYNKYVLKIFVCYKEVCRGDVNEFIAHHKTYLVNAGDTEKKSNLDGRGLFMATGFPRNCNHGTDRPS
jgi:hypothetical protein